MSNSTSSIEMILSLWEKYFPDLDFPDVKYLNAWRMKFTGDEIIYSFDVTTTALQTGRIEERNTERVGRYISATLKKQREQHEEVQAAIERRCWPATLY